MSIAQNLLNFLSKKSESEKIEAPDDFCPNCWGRQEYAGKFYEAVKNNSNDAGISDPHVGWIQEYADKHLSDIQIKADNDYVCPKCSVQYKPAS